MTVCMGTGSSNYNSLVQQQSTVLNKLQIQNNEKWFRVDRFFLSIIMERVHVYDQEYDYDSEYDFVCFIA